MGKPIIKRWYQNYEPGTRNLELYCGMYKKHEAAKIREEFWTVFGQYMSPQLSAEGEKINWINYKTGVKYIQLRLSADNRSATISIDMLHPDEAMRVLYFRQFEQLKKIFATHFDNEWQWQQSVANEHNRPISRIYSSLDNVNLFKREDWPAIISFFKPRLIALDAFWSNVKYSFEMLK
jgi:hypothetical protein